MLIKSIKNLSKTDVAIAGGKGASLGEMTQAGIPVPPGFVVLASAFEAFLAATDLNMEIETALKRVDKSNVETVEQASEKIRDLIADAAFPTELAKIILAEFAKLGVEHVAVRSSATAEDSSAASWAGELESYLNTTQRDLLVNVKKCWASLFTPRAIFYRIERGLHQAKVSVAVVVQAMIQSEVSGICFTVHPVTKDRDQMVIEAGYGLGEAIVGGLITPDTYIVHKKEKNILDKNIGQQKKMIIKSGDKNITKPVAAADQSKQKMPDRQVLALAVLGQRIENHYKKPQDIEWAWADGKFFIVQSRPITTL